MSTLHIFNVMGQWGEDCICGKEIPYFRNGVYGRMPWKVQQQIIGGMGQLIHPIGISVAYHCVLT
ncbi:MAG: hypothetical protein JRF69_11100 [Deltaproteobacteria bacterium]|nr:hypothetical protein [Deltaproteobacteria bacterium]